VSTLSQLEGMHGGVGAKRATVEDARSHRGDATVGLEQGARDLHTTVAAVAAGEVEHDPDLLDRLYATVREHQALTTVRVTNYPEGPVAAVVDLAGEARVEGAERALAAAERELEQFVRDNLPALAAERARVSQQIGIRAVAAAAAASRSRREWEVEARWWTQTLRLAGQADLAVTIPVNPFVTLEPAPGATEKGPVPHGLFP